MKVSRRTAGGRPAQQQRPLVFDLQVTPESWTIRSSASPPRQVASPLADERFRGLVATLREWICRAVPLDRPDPLLTAEFVARRARQVSTALTDALLNSADRRAVVRALEIGERARLAVRVRSAAPAGDLAADAVLALPWELLAPEEGGTFPVQSGRLAVLREAAAPGSPSLRQPTGPFTVAASIAAPEDRAVFPYEQEAFRLVAALSVLGQRAVFTNLGSLDDLVRLMDEVRAHAIHFRGHGFPGGLLFENELGLAVEVPVSELRRRLATVLLNPRNAGAFPGLFFLSAPFAAREPAPPDEPAGGPAHHESAVAAALHRSGFAQVVGYFGPVDPELSSRLEESFYGSLAGGRSTPDAAEEARAALLKPVGAAGQESHYPFGWCQLAVYHRGPDRPLAVPRQSGQRPPRFRRKTVAVNGLPVLERGFIGRRELLHAIRRRLQEGQRLLVLQGLGGLGKTALATHLLTAVLEVRPADLLILRCRVLEGGSGDPFLELRIQAEEHGSLHRFDEWEPRVRRLRTEHLDPVDGLAAAIRELRRERPELAVYVDNAESLQIGPRSEAEADLGSWRPGADRWWQEMERLADGPGRENEGIVLASTRYTWEGLTPRAHLGVGPLSPSESLRLINSYPSLSRLSSGDRAKLAEAADGHPRSVDVLARLVERRRRPRTAKGNLQHQEESIVDRIAVALPAQARWLARDLLLERLWTQIGPAARLHARNLGVLRRPAPGFVIRRLGNAMSTLIRSGLLSPFVLQVEKDRRPHRSQRWAMHSLVRSLVSRETGAVERDAAHRAAAAAYEGYRQEGELATWDDVGEGIHHFVAAALGDRAWPLVEEYAIALRREARFQEVREVLEQCEGAGLGGERLLRCLVLQAQVRMSLGEQGVALEPLLDRALTLSTDDKHRVVVLHEIGLLHYRQGRYRDAEEALREALALSAEADPYGTAAILHALAIVVDRLGRLPEAAELLQGSREIFERLGDDIGRAASLHALASVLWEQGRLREAEDLLGRAIAAFAERLGEDHPDYAASVWVLAGVLEDEGAYLEAEHLLRSSLAIEEARFGARRPRYGSSLCMLADLLVDQGRYDEAERVLRPLLDQDDSTFVPRHPRRIAALQSMATLRERQGRYGETTALLRRALACAEATLGAAHPTYGKVLHDLADALDTQGLYSEAAALVRNALEILERSYGNRYPYLGRALRTLASVTVHQGYYGEAEGLLRIALAIVEETLGNRHPDHAETLHDLAAVINRQGRHAAAEELFQQALAADEEELGTDHPSYAASLAGLADAVEGQGRFAAAEEIHRRALAILERTVGTCHPQYGRCLHGLADVLVRRGRPDEAELLLRQALAIDEATLGAGHPLMGATLHALAMALEARGSYAEAEQNLRQALEITAATVGPIHPAYGASLHNLAEVLRRQDRLGEAEVLLEDSLELLRRRLGPQHPSCFTVLHSLAGVLLLGRRWSEAEELLRRSLAGVEAAFGGDHPRLAPTLTSLAIACAQQGRVGEAELLLLRALKIAIAVHRWKSHEVGQILVTFAQVEHLLGRPNARAIAREAIEILTGAFGRTHATVREAVAALQDLTGETPAESRPDDVEGG